MEVRRDGSSTASRRRRVESRFLGARGPSRADSPYWHAAESFAQQSAGEHQRGEKTARGDPIHR